MNCGAWFLVFLKKRKEKETIAVTGDVSRTYGSRTSGASKGGRIGGGLDVNILAEIVMIGGDDNANTTIQSPMTMMLVA